MKAKRKTALDELAEDIRAKHAHGGAGGGDDEGYNIVDGREARLTRLFIVEWLRSDRFRTWSPQLQEVADFIVSGDGGKLPWDDRCTDSAIPKDGGR